MSHKSETRTHLINSITFFTAQFSSTLKCIRTDNGYEFLMSDFYKSKGIMHHISYVKCPQQNGIVERKHQHVLNVARSLFFQANIPKHF